MRLRPLRALLLLAAIPSLLGGLFWYIASAGIYNSEHHRYTKEEARIVATFHISYQQQEENWRRMQSAPPDPANPRAEFEFVVALSQNGPKLKSIFRMKTPAPHYFRDYIAPSGLPVIFTDMLQGTVFQEWNWDYLKRRFGHVVFNNTRQGDYKPSSTKLGKQDINRISVRFSDFIDVVSGLREALPEERDMYITKQRLLPRDALLEEFVWPPFYNNKGLKCYLEPSAWIGGAGTFTQGHFDSKDNFAYQIIGEKQWTIYPPCDYDKLYFIKAEGKLEWSQALAGVGNRPDLRKYPLLAETRPLTFTLRQGEVLYLPRGWTHMVENRTPAVMVNVWRKGPPAMGARFVPDKQREIRRLCMD